MKNILLLLTLFIALLSLSGCVNRHGISLKYYSDCKEYYDVQGYYHKDCGKDDLVTYKEMKKVVTPTQKQQDPNVW
jgi:hypothetical protein